MATSMPLALAFFLVLVSLTVGCAQASSMTLANGCVDRYDVQPSPSSCAYGSLPFTVDTGTVGEQSTCTLSSGNGTSFLVPSGVQQLFLIPPSAPAGPNKIRCNVTKTSFVEKPFMVYGATLDAIIDTPSLVYMDSTVSLKVMSVGYDLPDDASPGFSACWNLRDPGSGQVIAQWVCSNATTTYPVPSSLPIGQSQFILLLQAHNYESLFKYVPVTIRSAPTFSSSIYPESAIVPTSGGRLDYTISVAAFSTVDLTASWSDGRLTLDGKPSSVVSPLHVEAGKTGRFSLAFDVPQALGCTGWEDCPGQRFSISLADQYGNSQQLAGEAVVTDRYTSSFYISPESLGRIVVQPGLEVQAEVTLTNNGRLPDEYSAVLIGDAAPYSGITPETMTLGAGGSGTYVVKISGSSSLLSGPLRACFSSGNQPSVQKCANATISPGAQELPVALFVQPRSMSLSVGENRTIEVAAVSSIKDAVFSGILESTCADWLSNTEWVTVSRTVSGRYTNEIYVKPTDVGTCTVKMTLRAQGAPPRSATVEIAVSMPEAEIDAVTMLSEDILLNLTVFRSKANVLKAAGVDAGFISGLEQRAASLAGKCGDDVSMEEYSAAQTSCAIAMSGLKNAAEVLDYGGRALHVSRPLYVSPVAIASALLIVLSLVYLIAIAPPPSPSPPTRSP